MADTRLHLLPRDAADRPVPWFSWFNLDSGRHDARIVEAGRVDDALRLGLCWVCGGPLGTGRASYVAGPMCLINLVSAEPGAHHACAEESVRVCPFLTNPDRARRTGGLPAQVEFLEGHNPRNPAVSVIITARRWSRLPGRLLQLDRVETVSWWTRGRPATRGEAVETLASGAVALRQAAEQDGPRALDRFTVRLAAAERWLPSS